MPLRRLIYRDYRRVSLGRKFAIELTEKFKKGTGRYAPVEDQRPPQTISTLLARCVRMRPLTEHRAQKAFELSDSCHMLEKLRWEMNNLDFRQQHDIAVAIIIHSIAPLPVGCDGMVMGLHLF